eukprot:TRINITY_DN709_c2_g2_i4.p1 TRINITY_DN709_c2_g2~~TRINITY_DN709_c2_g2_i4.p1  ORF type:complete len:348 (+),score=85.24 TRINITY_DN709_c2_g2_i4:68-1111(+)
MGPLQWLQRVAWVPEDSSVDRVRKQVVVSCYTVIGAVLALWCVVFAAADPDSEAQRRANTCKLAAAVCAAVFLLSASAHVIATKRVSRQVCEIPALVGAICTIVADAGYVLVTEPSIVYYNVLVLDGLLLCRASDAAPRIVVGVTALWIVVKSVLEVENVAGDDCHTEIARFSGRYFQEAAGAMTDGLLVLLVDFIATRGFAKSMHEQKAMVEASIQLSEAAAVLLSKYETEDTKTLLDGPDGGRLPAGLRQALLQLVTNLALYRPYLPQSCLPGDTSVDMLGLHDADSSVQILTASQSLCSSAVNCSTLASEDLRTYSCVARGLVQAETKCRNVSLVAATGAGRAT